MRGKHLRVSASFDFVPWVLCCPNKIPGPGPERRSSPACDFVMEHQNNSARSQTENSATRAVSTFAIDK